MNLRDTTRDIIQLSPDAQTLLLCLTPFTGVVFQGALKVYSDALRKQPALAHLPYERWGEVLQEAVNWGLLTPHEVEGFLEIQPTLAYFLRSRLQATEQAGRRAAVETAFRELYGQWGGAIAQMLQSKDAREKRTGQALAGLEFENLWAAVQLALAAQASFFNPYEALFRYLHGKQMHQRSISLCERVLATRGEYPTEALAGDIGLHFYLAFARLATSQLMMKQYDKAEQAYKDSLELVGGLRAESEETRGNYTAIVYHQLGRVAEEQRQWAQANQYYQQALAIFIEFNDGFSPASTYHQLGMVAQARRQWAQAEQYYQQALAIFIEFNDRYALAATYHQLGMVVQEQRQLAQAEQYYQQALAIKIEFNDRYNQASTYHQLGMVAQQQWQWAQANQYYQQALAIWIEFNDRYAQARPYYQLGIVAQAQRQWAQANQYYQQVLAIWIEFDDRYKQADTYHQLGMVAQAQWQWAQAREYYLTALQIGIEYNDAYRVSTPLQSLANYWRERKDADLPAAVAAVLNVSLDEAQSLLS